MEKCDKPEKFSYKIRLLHGSLFYKFFMVYTVPLLFSGSFWQADLNRGIPGLPVNRPEIPPVCTRLRERIIKITLA